MGDLQKENRCDSPGERGVICRCYPIPKIVGLMYCVGHGTLGLSMSYDIVKAHGGELKVNSKDGEGAEFVVQIPLM